MDIVVNTTYTYERLVKFNNFFAKTRKAIWIPMGILLVFYLLLFVLDYAMYRYVNIEYLSAGLFFIFITVLYIVLMFVVPKSRLKKSKSLNSHSTVTFKETYFEAQLQSALVSEVCNISYDLIYRLMEDEGNIYIFVSRNAAHILDKNGFANGTVDELKAFLRTRVEPKKIKFK